MGIRLALRASLRPQLELWFGLHTLAFNHTSWSTDRTQLLNVQDHTRRVLLLIPLSDVSIHVILVRTQTKNVVLNISLLNVPSASRTTGKILKIVHTVTLSCGLFKSVPPDTPPRTCSMLGLILLAHGHNGWSCLHPGLWLRPAFFEGIYTTLFI